MSQATLSEQIKLLEQELGVRLFERGRNLTLTESGHVLLERAERILEEVKSAQAEMQEFAHLDRGQLIFGTMTGVGTAWLPSFLAAFMRQHPHVDLTLVERASGLLIKLLQNREIHVACLLVPAEQPDVPPDISTRELFRRELVVVAAPTHPLARMSRVTLDDLVSERLILTSPNEGPRTVVDRAFHAHGLEPLVGFEADDPATLIGLAIEGVGVGITSDRVADLAAGRVVPLRVEGLQMRYSMSLAWSEHGPHTRAMSTFLDFAAEWLGEWGARTQAERAAPASAPAIT